MPQPYEDPIRSIVDGMLRGHALASQIKYQNLQQEAFVRNAARQDREEGIQQIMTRMNLLDQGALEVDPYGLVNETRPELRGGGTDLGAGIILPGSSTPGGTFLRKAKSPVTIAGPAGKMQFELPSEEQRSARRISRSREGKSPIDLPGGQVAWVDPKEIPEMQQTMLENGMVDTPTAYRVFGGPAQVPRKQLPQVQTVVNSMLGRQEAAQRAEDTLAAQNQRAREDRTSRERIAGAQQETSRGNAMIRAGTAAATQENLATRQEKTQSAIEQRQERNFLEREHEPKLHERRRTVRQVLADGKDVDSKGNEYKLSDTQKQKAKTDLVSIEDQIQGVQLRKAKLYGVKQAPTKQEAAKLPRDTPEFQGPDGRVWQKIDGILYFVR